MASTWTSSRGRFAAVVTLAMASSAALLGGCPGTLEGGKDAYLPTGGDNGEGGDEPGGCGDVPALLTTSCGKPGCHSSAEHVAEIDLQTQGFGQALLGKQGSSTCMMAPILDPFNSDGSLLYTKLLAPAKCGSQMPLGGTPFEPAQIQCVKAWIESVQPGN